MAPSSVGPAAPPAVPWKDLVPLSRAETLLELLLPLPWLVLGVSAAQLGLDVVAVPATFFFFLSALRLVHDFMHGNLGLPRAVDHALLTLFSALMVCSLHAVLVSHVWHHRRCLEDDDLEGRAARGSALAALLHGPAFTVNVHAEALRGGSARQRSRVRRDLVAIGLFVVFVLALLPARGLLFHLVAMLAANAATGFFCVWTVHRGCRSDGVLARTLRGGPWNRIFFHMFLHLEHHWFPRVPTKRLPALASRLDAASKSVPFPRVFARTKAGGG